MNETSFGYPLTNERQYIIFILLSYLIYNTNILFIKGGLFIILCIHIYKLYYNYKINNRIYKENIIYNLLLLISLIIFIQNNNNYLIFIVLFIITGVIFRRMNDNLYKYNNNKKNDIIFIIILILQLIVYPNYKFNYIIWMEIINHLLILRDKTIIPKYNIL